MSAQNLLVPIDFSENSLNGLQTACTIAKKFNSKLHLVSAFHVPTPTTDIGMVPSVIESFYTDYKDEIEENLQELEKDVPMLKEVDYDRHVYGARTLDAIYTAIKNLSIDLVVMGTRKTHDGIEHLFGGVSTDVIRFAECPVLVIPEQFHSFEPRKIAIAVDYKSFKDLHKLSVVSEICKSYNASLSVVHVGESDGPESAEQLMEMSELNEIFEDLNVNFETAHGKKVHERLINYIDDNQIDLLVMMPRSHDLFERIFSGSITKKVALDIHIPLLTVHE